MRHLLFALCIGLPACADPPEDVTQETDIQVRDGAIFFPLIMDHLETSRRSSVGLPLVKGADQLKRETSSYDVSTVRYVVLRQGYASDWQPSGPREEVMVLRGTLEVETTEHGAARYPAGSVILFRDSAGKGHIRRAVSEEDVVLAVLQLDPSPE